MYQFNWNPIETKCDQRLPEEVIEKIFHCISYYYTRYDEVTHRRTTYPMKKEVNWNFYDFADNSFPSGFLGEVVRQIGESECEVIATVDKPQRIFESMPKFLEYLKKNDYELRYFQKEAGKLIEEYANGICEIGTGGGKTILYGYITALLGVQTIVLTIDTNSREQTFNEFVSFFGREYVGLIEEQDYHKPILIANIQNCWAKRNFDLGWKKYCKDTGLLIVNEAHHINESKMYKIEHITNTWYSIVQSIPAWYRVGATGTVGKLGSLQRILIQGAIGDVIYTKSTKELTDEGYLTKMIAHIWKIPSNNIEREYVKSYDSMITDPYFRGSIEKIIRYYVSLNKKVIVFCDWKEKSALPLYEQLKDIAVMVHGEIKQKDRPAIIKEFESGKYPVMIGTVFSEDFNLPAIDVGIIIGKKKNERSVKQRTGRMMRLFTGKTEGIVAIPYVQDYREATIKGTKKLVDGKLAEHSAEAVKILQGEGHEIIWRDIKELESK